MTRYGFLLAVMAIAPIVGYPTMASSAFSTSTSATAATAEQQVADSTVPPTGGGSPFPDAAASTVAQAQSNAPLALVRRFQHGNNVNALAFSEDGQWLATTGGDRRIRVWNVDALLRGDERNYLARVINLPESDHYATSLTFAPDRRWLVSSTYNGDVRIWDLNACDPERNTCASDVLSERDYRAVDPMVRFHPSSVMLACSNYDGTVTLWDWQTRTVYAVLEAETGAHTGDRIDGRFSSIDFDPSGRFLVAGNHDKTLTFWDFEEEMERTLVLETAYGVDSVAFSPVADVVANSNLRGLELREFRYSGGRLRMEEPVVLENHGRINTMMFSPDGRYLLSGDNNGDITLWDIEEEESLVTIPSNQGHSRAVLDMVYDPTRDMVASGSADGSILLWQINPVE